MNNKPNPTPAPSKPPTTPPDPNAPKKGTLKFEAKKGLPMVDRVNVAKASGGNQLKTSKFNINQA